MTFFFFFLKLSIRMPLDKRNKNIQTAFDSARQISMKQVN